MVHKGRVRSPSMVLLSRTDQPPYQRPARPLGGVWEGQEHATKHRPELEIMLMGRSGGMACLGVTSYQETCEPQTPSQISFNTPQLKNLRRNLTCFDGWFQTSSFKVIHQLMKDIRRRKANKESKAKNSKPGKKEKKGLVEAVQLEAFGQHARDRKLIAVRYFQTANAVMVQNGNKVRSPLAVRVVYACAMICLR